MKNVLITGGAGFLGSHLVATLLKDQQTNVIAIDNFITSEYFNIEEFVREPHFEFLKGDLTKPISLEKFSELAKFKLKIYGIEEIYHLACPTSPKDYDHFPLETCLANSHATHHALEIAQQYKSRFLFVSASAIYGNVPHKEQPIKETARGILDTLGPRSCYSDGKRFAENLVMYWGAEHNIEVKIARVFHTYGPKMRLEDGRLIPDFVLRALENKDLTIYGDQNTTSTFCYVDDMIDALMKMMRSEESGPINFGNPQLYTITDIAQAIIKFTKARSNITYTDPLPYRDPEPVPDITRAREKLGWLPVTSIEDGLIQTITTMRASDVLKFTERKNFQPQANPPVAKNN